jgi:DNA primase
VAIPDGLKEIIRQMRESADLVAMVSEKAKLHRSGSGWLGGPCPIHKGGSKTACLSVQPEKNHWKCFACGAGGDALDWLVQTEGLDWWEAAQHLSQLTGIALPEKAKAEHSEPTEALRKALADCQDFFQAQLLLAPAALAYLESRGFHAHLRELAGLGYAPEGWTVTGDHLEKKGHTLTTLDDAGILGRTQSGKLIDFLRDRITIPIMDPRGKVIAFGGRCLPGAPKESPKYLNTKETPIFQKGNTLYGLHHARGSMRDEGAVLVEGYFDVLSLWNAGVNNAVAGMGTALTDQQLNQIQKWTRKITLLYDGDSAGQNATAQALTKALPAEFDVRILTLPQGEDPDTWVRKMEEPKCILRNAPDWLNFKISRAMADKDSQVIAERLAAAREVADWLGFLPNARRREAIKLLAFEMKVPSSSLLAKAQPSKSTATKAKAEPFHDMVAQLLLLVAKGGPFRDWVSSIPAGWWEYLKGANVLEDFLATEGDVEALGPEAQEKFKYLQHMESQGLAPDLRTLRTKMQHSYLKEEVSVLIQAVSKEKEPTKISDLQASLHEIRGRILFLESEMRCEE